MKPYAEHPAINLETGEVSIQLALIKQKYCNNPKHPNNEFEAYDEIKAPCDCANGSGSWANVRVESDALKRLKEYQDGAWEAKQENGRNKIRQQVGDALTSGRDDINLATAQSLLEPTPTWLVESMLKSQQEIVDTIQAGPTPITLRRYFWQLRLPAAKLYVRPKSNFNRGRTYYVRDVTGTNPDGTPCNQKPFIFVKPLRYSNKWYRGIITR